MEGAGPRLGLRTQPPQGRADRLLLLAEVGVSLGRGPALLPTVCTERVQQDPAGRDCSGRAGPGLC